MQASRRSRKSAYQITVPALARVARTARLAATFFATMMDVHSEREGMSAKVCRVAYRFYTEGVSHILVAAKRKRRTRILNPSRGGRHHCADILAPEFNHSTHEGGLKSAPVILAKNAQKVRVHDLSVRVQ